jgi:hypothetical protein
VVKFKITLFRHVKRFSFLSRNLKNITHLSYQSNDNILGTKAMDRRIYIWINMEMGQLMDNFDRIIKTILA